MKCITNFAHGLPNINFEFVKTFAIKITFSSTLCVYIINRIGDMRVVCKCEFIPWKLVDSK